MILTDNTSRLEINLSHWDGDAYVTVKIDSMGYCGENDLHIHSIEFKRFCKDILELQRTLKGKAELNSISPDELSIVVKPFDRLGHISVVGKCGYHAPTAHTTNWHSVEFGFEIDPQQLDKAVRAEWVTKYAI